VQETGAATNQASQPQTTTKPQTTEKAPDKKTAPEQKPEQKKLIAEEKPKTDVTPKQETKKAQESEPKKATEKKVAKNTNVDNEDSELQILLNKAQEKRSSEKRIAYAAKADTKAPALQSETGAAVPSGGATTVRIKRNDKLVDIAKEHYGRKEYWVYIYQENKSKIPNPNNVSPGTTLNIPSITKYVKNPRDPNSVKKAKDLEKQILNK
jgi:nucleoid-associated protein YgaU